MAIARPSYLCRAAAEVSTRVGELAHSILVVHVLLHSRGASRHVAEPVAGKVSEVSLHMQSRANTGYFFE